MKHRLRRAARSSAAALFLLTFVLWIGSALFAVQWNDSQWFALADEGRLIVGRQIFNERGLRFRAVGSPRLRLHFGNRPPDFSWYQSATPLWFPMALFAAFWAFLRRPRRRWACRWCDYDLRATPGRCPECGNVNDATELGRAPPNPGKPPSSHARAG